ncbi:MAG TPA: helix-turn-helix domain-containing protein [Gemmataceae bacterium]|nr:helix-turn-helix domain-containing protein [Gemmataceae bacterium]
MDDTEITAQEAAEILDVTSAHVRWYHRNGHLPGRRIGNLTLVFKRSDVEALAKNKPQKTGRPPKPVEEKPTPKATPKRKKGGK